MDAITDYVTFNDPALAKKYTKKKIPMAKLYEAYFDGDVDIEGDIYDLLDNRDKFVKYSLTLGHFKWAVTNFLPEVLIHSRSQDQRIVQEHYDRGNDFFEWFLGDTMVYTSAFYENADDSLEDAQRNKMDLVCRKLQLEPGETFLDIGCGWGTLVQYAAENYGVNALGVTLAEEQAAHANARIADAGLSDRAEVRTCDYRDLPESTFDKIASLEMVEHVGVKNLSQYYEGVYDLLEDDGLFYLQWTGLRRDMRPEDLIWGLFMNKYVFPGADASLCLWPMSRQMEKADFEIHSIENVTNHYGLTIKDWHDNWRSNREEILEAYGERWYRIWNFFLAWSTYIARQGNAACFQVVLNKNLDSFDRYRWVGDDAEPSLGERFDSLDADDLEAAEEKAAE
jgi:cyclopropane fatty-acyl-phospholipid synthase-like methyltransferase